MLKIERDVALPPARSRVRLFPFPDMRPGDSFLVENSGTVVRAAASRYARKNGMRFVTRRVEGGVRVWRVE